MAELEEGFALLSIIHSSHHSPSWAGDVELIAPLLSWSRIFRLVMGRMAPKIDISPLSLLLSPYPRDVNRMSFRQVVVVMMVNPLSLSPPPSPISCLPNTLVPYYYYALHLVYRWLHAASKMSANRAIGAASPNTAPSLRNDSTTTCLRNPDFRTVKLLLYSSQFHKVSLCHICLIA